MKLMTFKNTDRYLNKDGFIFSNLCNRLLPGKKIFTFMK